MPEKELAQRKAADSAAPDQSMGKSMTPPAFQLKAESGADGNSGGNGGAALAKVAQKKDDKKQKAPKVQKMEQGPGYKIYKTSDSIVTVPDGATGNLPIAMIYGGMGDATKEFMKNQVPGSLFATHILAFANYTTYYVKSVKPDIESAMASSAVSGSYSALLGFSAGGYRVEGAKGDEGWGVIGMIDAVAFDNATYPAPVLHVWNLWGNNTEKTDARAKLHQRIINKEVKGSSERDKKVGHMGMPKRWFELYGSSL
ncbi:MAG TPA: hypothetical protein VHS96_12905 [Bacteroidia bacterium]|nr:hypothetical protein [Bacteroidia bacterium]